MLPCFEIFAVRTNLCANFLAFVDPCWKTKCNHYAKCVATADRKAECVCPTCKNEYVPVCGADEMSYASECYLKMNACKVKRNLFATKRGSCG